MVVCLCQFDRYFIIFKDNTTAIERYVYTMVFTHRGWQGFFHLQMKDDFNTMLQEK